MFRLRKKPSAWSYESSAGVGAQVSLVVSVGAGKGTILLKHPSGPRISFNYASAGVGAGVGLKVTKTFELPSASGDPGDFPSDGKVFIAESFPGSELGISDFEGACMIVEGSAAFVAGGAVTAMLLGIPPQKLPNELLSRLAQLSIGISGGQVAHDNAPPIALLASSAKAALMMGGMTAGANVGAGILGSVGYVWHGQGDIPVDLSPQEGYEGPARITTSDDWMIVIPGRVLFDTDESRIKREAESALHNAGKRIRSLPQHRTIINGHTDSRASDSYNLTLSEKRANAVKQWLVGKGYLKEGQATAHGQGERNPVRPNNSPQNMEQNRRVEILLVRNPPASAKLPKDWYLKAFEPRFKLPLFK